MPVPPPSQPDRYRHHPRPYPPTVEGKLDELLKRVGRIEAMVIDLRDGNTRDPDKPKYYIDPDMLR